MLGLGTQFKVSARAANYEYSEGPTCYTCDLVPRMCGRWLPDHAPL